MEILLLFTLAVIVIIWYETLRIRERVIKRCHLLCKEAELQLLDQTVAMVSISIARSSNGLPCLARRYQFEVSEDGVERYSGNVHLLGWEFVLVSFDSPAGTMIYEQNSYKRLQ